MIKIRWTAEHNDLAERYDHGVQGLTIQSRVGKSPDSAPQARRALLIVDGSTQADPKRSGKRADRREGRVPRRSTYCQRFAGGDSWEQESNDDL